MSINEGFAAPPPKRRRHPLLPDEEADNQQVGNPTKGVGQ